MTSHGWFSRRNWNYQSKAQRQEEVSTKTGQDESFCLFLQVFDIIAAAYSCPHGVGAEWLFLMVLPVMQLFSPSSFWPPNQFFPLSFGKKKRFCGGGRSNFLLIACLFLSILSPFQFLRAGFGVFCLFFSHFQWYRWGRMTFSAWIETNHFPRPPWKKPNLLN